METLADRLWLRVVDDLWADHAQRKATARATLVRAVRRYVEHDARLPSAVPGDTGARRQLAVRVLHRLTRDDNACLRDWRARAGRRCDHCTWSTLLQVVTVHQAFAHRDDHPLGAGAAVSRPEDQR